MTGEDPTPIELSGGCSRSRPDLVTHHEEADTILIQHLKLTQPKRAVVLADDTDIFVLLLHFIHTGDLKSEVVMQSPKRSSRPIDVNATATADENQSVLPDILAVRYQWP